MRPTVLHQVPFLPETQATSDAHESLLLDMDASVKSHLVRDAKGSATNVASERLVTSVDGDVRVKRRTSRKMTIAKGTFEWQRVSPQMGEQSGPLGERFRTDGACEWSEICVDLLVIG